MSGLKRNLIANSIGAGWLALSGLIFAPIFIHLMGIESYGLIGFYYMLQAALQIFDLGLSPTINREMARYSVQPDQSDQARDFVRTFEAGYWGIGLVLGVLVWVAAPFIATHWLKAAALSNDSVLSSVLSMAVLVALQWPLTLYEGGLLGLQQHVLLNSLGVTVTAFRTIGAVLFLELVSPTIVNFFLWQIMVSVVHVGAIAVLFWRSLPPSRRAPRVDIQQARRVWHFAAGMTGNTLSWFILGQLDKIILSAAVSLEAFSYYILASSIANSLRLMVASPIFNTVYPRFSALSELVDTAQIRSFYHFSSQLLAVLVFPLAAVLGFFSYEIIVLWIGSPAAAQSIAPIASLLIIGTSLSALEAIPYALQLAQGRTSIGLSINVGSILVYIPLLLGLVGLLDAVGAAASWAVLGCLRILSLVLLTHRRTLKGDAKYWLWVDNVPPLLGCVGVVLLGKYFLANNASSFAMIMSLLFVFVTAFVAALIFARMIRERVLALIASYRRTAIP